MKSTSRNSNLSFSAKKRTRPVRVGFSFCQGWSVWYPVRRDTPIDGGIALFAPVFDGETPLSRLSSVRKSLLLRQQLKTPIFCDKKIFTHKISGFLFLCYAKFDLFCYIFCYIGYQGKLSKGFLRRVSFSFSLRKKKLQQYEVFRQIRLTKSRKSAILKLPHNSICLIEHGV